MSTYYAEGNYVGLVTEQALGKAQTGTKQFVLRFKVLGTPDGEAYTPAVQQYERTIFMAITDRTVEYVVPALEKLGYNRASLGPLDPSHPEHQSFAGQQVDVYCKHESDQSGQMREKWGISRGSSGLKVTALNSREVRELDALFGKELSRARVNTPVVPAVVAVATDGTEITDDDIPF